MTKKLMIALIAVVAVLLGVSVYFIFFMPSEQVYNGVLIEYGIKQACELLKAA